MCLANHANSAKPNIKIDGTCVKRCDDYDAPDASTNECRSEGCLTKNTPLWTNFDGTCVTDGQPCANYSKKATEAGDALTNKKCIRDACVNGWFKKADGSCAATAADCGDYFYAGEDAADGVKKCLVDTCGSGDNAAKPVQTV